MGTGNGGRTVLEFEEEVHFGWRVGVGCSRSWVVVLREKRKRAGERLRGGGWIGSGRWICSL